MNFRTLMQAGPAKTNELFSRLSETSDGAVKTREKLFAELKAKLELHTSLEEQHLFPILRRNAETKELVADAMKDNKELRAKLAELEALSKNDEVFPERLKELQKTFRQHARDEKRELLPAVQRALSEEQVQGVAEKIEAGVAEAEQARQDELEERRAKARQEREQAERHAEQQQAAERAKAAAEQARQDEAEQKRARAQHEREQAERQAEQQAAARWAQDATERRVRDTAGSVARTATTAQANALRVAETTVTSLQHVGEEIGSAAGAYTEAVRTQAPDLRELAAFPQVAISGMTEIHTAWMERIAQTLRAGTQMSQDLLRLTAERQRRFGVEVVQGWMEHNAHIMRTTLRMVQESLRPFGNRSAALSDERRSGR